MAIVAKPRDASSAAVPSRTAPPVPEITSTPGKGPGPAGRKAVATTPGSSTSTLSTPGPTRSRSTAACAVAPSSASAVSSKRSGAAPYFENGSWTSWSSFRIDHSSPWASQPEYDPDSGAVEAGSTTPESSARKTASDDHGAPLSSCTRARSVTRAPGRTPWTRMRVGSSTRPMGGEAVRRTGACLRPGGEGRADAGGGGGAVHRDVVDDVEVEVLARPVGDDPVLDLGVARPHLLVGQREQRGVVAVLEGVEDLVVQLLVHHEVAEAAGAEHGHLGVAVPGLDRRLDGAAELQAALHAGLVGLVEGVHEHGHHRDDVVPHDPLVEEREG